MTNFLLYLLKVSVAFSTLVICYRLCWRSLPFHRLNRALLLAFIPLSLLLPVLPITGFFWQNTVVTPLPWNSGGAFNALTQAKPVVQEVTAFPWPFLLCWVYGLGLSFFLLRFLFQTFQLLRLVRKAAVQNHGRAHLVPSPHPFIFSFFHWIFIPTDKGMLPEGPIWEHEKAHAALWHSVDLILASLFQALTWFNPLHLLYRAMVKSVHEYQADAKVLRQYKRSAYLTALLNDLLPEGQLSLSSSFKSVTIKNRIHMMTQNNSNNNRKGMRYAWLLPLSMALIFTLASFTGTPPAIFPLQKGEYGKITATFQQHIKVPQKGIDKTHGGIDISAKIGTNVHATGAGKVIKAQKEGAWGNLVIIDHGDGYVTYYAHLQNFTVKAGDQVRQGEVIGHVGVTGKSTGPHLHYEVHHNGKKVNPENYFSK